jgi:hypothetical protein
MMAKGTYAGVNLATKDLDGVFARLQASGVEVVQEPTEQPYGVRDCAVRDPAGNLIRIQELTGVQVASLTTRRDRQPAQWWPPRLTLRPETHRSSSLERLAGKCCPGKDSRG